MKGVKLGLIGDPVDHSLSPVMMRAALRARGLEGDYHLLPTPARLLGERLDEVRADFRGVNVTVPHKRRVMDRLDAVEPEARRVGAVNVIVNEGGRLVGHNTDAAGFYRALERADALPGEALVLGAGGAARAVVHALVSAGWLVGVHNRTLERAQRLVEELGGWLVVPGKLEKAVRRTPMLINATSVGLGDPNASPLPEGWLPEAGVVVDLVYAPLETRLLREARAAGLRTLDGLGMLLGQGALAFELWTGQPAPEAAMEAALREEATRWKP